MPSKSRKLINDFFNDFSSTSVIALIFATLGFAILLASLYSGAYVLVNWSRESSQLAEQYGSFVGGLVGSLFSLAGVILIYDTILKQQRLFEVERIESQIFELTRYHKENVNQLTYKGLKGISCFNAIEMEFQRTFEHLSAMETLSELTRLEIFEISSIVHVHGIRAVDFLKKIQPVSSNDILNKIIQSDYIGKYQLGKDELFENHDVRINHYIRHLGAILKTIRLDKRIRANHRTDLAKILRTQLSIAEMQYLFHMILALENRTRKRKWHEFVTEYGFFNPLYEAEPDHLRLEAYEDRLVPSEA